MSTPPIDSFDFIINRRAGTVLKSGEEKVRAEILTHFGAKAGDFFYVEPDTVGASVSAWAATYAGKNRGLIIGGGDGTVITAVERLLGRTDITFGVLPLGTQNMVARQLGFSPDVSIAAAQYKAGQPVQMDVGDINGMPFLIGLTIDQNTVKIYEAREDIRDGKIFSALRKSFAGVAGLFGGKKDKLVISDSNGFRHKINSRLVMIMPNKAQPLSAKGFPFSAKGLKDIFARIIHSSNVSTGELSLYAFKGGLFRTLGLVPSLLRGAWDRSRLIQSESASRFVVHAKEATEATIGIDGEIKKTQYPLDIRIIPKGVRIFKPEQ